MSKFIFILSIFCAFQGCARRVTEPEIKIAQHEGKIVFISNRDGNREIYIMDSDGINQINLTHNQTADWRPIFKPW